MFSANEARNLMIERDKYLMEIEDEIKKASIDGDNSIIIVVGDWNEKDFQRIRPILQNNGYDINMTGIAGWNSYYYRISW